MVKRKPRYMRNATEGRLFYKICSQVKIDDKGCWNYGGYKLHTGYGGVTFKGKLLTIHRLMYSFAFGEIPEGKVMDHLCRNRACCNPNHLEVVTNKINVLRGISPLAKNAQKTHCPQGHEYDETNTYVHDNKRACKKCMRERTRQFRLIKQGGY